MSGAYGCVSGWFPCTHPKGLQMSYSTAAKYIKKLKLFTKYTIEVHFGAISHQRVLAVCTCFAVDRNSLLQTARRHFISKMKPEFCKKRMTLNIAGGSAQTENLKMASWIRLHNDLMLIRLKISEPRLVFSENSRLLKIVLLRMCRTFCGKYA